MVCCDGHGSDARSTGGGVIACGDYEVHAPERLRGCAASTRRQRRVVRSVARSDHREGLGVREVGSLACACSLLYTRGPILCRALPSDDFFNTIIEMLNTIIGVSAMDLFLLKKLRSNDLFKAGKLREHMDRSSLRDAMSAVAPVAAQARNPPTPPRRLRRLRR